MAEAADQILTIGLSAVAGYGGRSPLPFTPTSLSRDFRELYLLSPEEIPDLLACARLVHRHLSGGGSGLAPADQEGLDRLIAEVGAAPQGPTGAGIFLEQQDSIAEDDGRRRRAGPVPLRLPAAAAGARAGGRDPAQPAWERARSRPSRISSSPNRYSLP
jgi:hypothetical protein